MSTRRRIGVSTATTEAARRQLMQPVPCWEKVWAAPPDAPAGSTLRVYRWVKTDKKQNFSDDEEEPDLPLAPLPELDTEANEGDDDMEQDDQATSAAPDSASRAVSEPAAPPPEQEESIPAPPKRHPLSMSLVPGSPTPTPEADESTMNAELDPAVNGGEELDDVPGTSLQVPPELSSEMNADLDMTQLGPDGEPFENSGNIAQLQTTDSLLGGEAMDETSDPFGPAQMPE
ncbi:hypothetical protein ACEPAI_449 [Sanghuangporus weigelae]